MSDDELKERIKSLEYELEKVKKESTQYLQNVAHQLTAPLNAIKWSIEALKDKDVPLARKQNLLRSVYSQATILVHLIKNFTLLSNLEMDHDLRKFRETPQEVDLLLLAINLANDFQQQANDLNKKIQVYDSTFKSVIGKRSVNIEKNLIAQTISNILENAVKYSSANSVIEIMAEKENNAVCLSVISQGLPIDTKDSEKIFERGYRGKDAIEKVPAGTGFGLYLVKRIMDLHGGKVSFEPKGNVSKFKLIFPEELFK
jgi:signal transduction histidine kinase